MTYELLLDPEIGADQFYADETEPYTTESTLGVAELPVVTEADFRRALRPNLRNIEAMVLDRSLET